MRLSPEAAEPKGLDGLSGVQVNMTNTSNMPIEATEMEFTKILARKYELKEDTGGAGQFQRRSWN